MGHYYKSPRVHWDRATDMIHVRDEKSQASVAWDRAPDQLRAKFSAEREDAMRKADAQPDAAPTGIVHFGGQVISVLDDGVLLPGPAEGLIVKVEGLSGFADGERVTVYARRTDRTYKYTTAAGGAATVRVYELIQD